MKKVTKSVGIAGLFLFASCAGTLAADDGAGVQSLSVTSKEREADLEVRIWYPAAAGGTTVTLGENIFFKGTSARQGAPIRDGEFPLVLLSHGAGLAGHAGAMSWIAAPLAQEGFIVAARRIPGIRGETGRPRKP